MQLTHLNSILTIIFCLIIPVAGMIGIAVIGTRTRIETVEQINRLRKAGSYEQWKIQNGNVVRLEQIGWAGLFGSILTTFVLARINPDYARYAFMAGIAFACLLMLTAFLFHHRIMQATIPAPNPKPDQQPNAGANKIKIGSLLFVFVALPVLISDKLSQRKAK